VSGGWGGAGKPVSAGGRFGCEFSIPDGFEGGVGDGCSEADEGDRYAKTCLRPAPLPCLVVS